MRFQRELWNSKSAELQVELRRVRTEMERHEVASEAYETAGLQILELAHTAYSSYVAKNPHEQARLIKHDYVESAPRRDFLGHGEAAPASADNSHIQGFEIRQTIPSRR